MLGMDRKGHEVFFIVFILIYRNAPRQTLAMQPSRLLDMLWKFVTGSSGSAMIHVAWIGEIKIKAEIRKKDNIDM